MTLLTEPGLTPPDGPRVSPEAHAELEASVLAYHRRVVAEAENHTNNEMLLVADVRYAVEKLNYPNDGAKRRSLAEWTRGVALITGGIAAAQVWQILRGLSKFEPIEWLDLALAIGSIVLTSALVLIAVRQERRGGHH